MNVCMARTTAFLCLCALVLPAVTSGRDYYVNCKHPKASDENPGTADEPWKTVQHAAAVVVPGDTVHVMPGVYPESIVLKPKPKDAKKPAPHPMRRGRTPARITFIADGDAPAIIDGAARLRPKDLKPTDVKGVFAWTPPAPLVVAGAGRPPQPLAWVFVGERRMILRQLYELRPYEIRDWAGLCSKMASDKEEASPGKRLWGLLTEEQQGIVRSASQGKKLTNEGQTGLLGRLNWMLTRRDFYQEAYFKGAVLPKESEEILKLKRRTPEQTRQLNRLALDASFPKEITPYRGPLTEKDHMSFARTKTKVYVNFDGKRVPDDLNIEVSFRPYGFNVTGLRNVFVKGFVLRRQVLQAIKLSGAYDCTFEDCDVIQPNMHGIVTGGDNHLLRRVRVYDSTMWGSNFFGTNHKVQECVFQRCGYRLEPAGEPWVGVLKSNGGSFHTVRHNLIIDRPPSRWKVGDVDVVRSPYAFPFGGIWFDCNNVDNRVYGNCIVGSPHAGCYIEYGLSRSIYQYNTIQDCAMGITFRQSWNNTVMNNWIFDSEALGIGKVDADMFAGYGHGGEDHPHWGREVLDGICFWHTFVEPPSNENIVMNNLVQVSGRCVSIPVPTDISQRAIRDAARIMCIEDAAILEKQIAAKVDYRTVRRSYKTPLNNICDRNLYVLTKNRWSKGFGYFLDRQVDTFDELRELTGLETSGKVGKFTPRDIGLQICWTLPPKAKQPDRPIAFDYDGGAERTALRTGQARFFYADNTAAAPYSWFRTTGELADAPMGARNDVRTWTQWPACRSGVRGLAIANPTTASRTSDPNVWLKHAKRIPASGLGWRTISVPVTPGTTMGVSVFLKAASVTPVNEDEGIEMFAHFCDWTGHNVRRIWLVGNGENRELAKGTYNWREVRLNVRVPQGVRRMIVYIGMRPGTGSVLVDDLTMGLCSPKAPKTTR